MRQYVLTRSAYGPGWDVEANRRRLALSRATVIPSMSAQTFRDFAWFVLLHPRDALLEERRAAFAAAGARFLYLDPDVDGTPQHVAFVAYRAGWCEAIGVRDEAVAMTRLDDDDALAPWVLGRIRVVASRATGRTALVCPVGIRVWRGCYTTVHHASNAMQTLVTPSGDELTVYGYKHREVRRVAPLRMVDPRPAWVWSRHPDTISGWHSSGRPLTPAIRAMFPIDWSVFGAPHRTEPVRYEAGRCFR